MLKRLNGALLLCLFANAEGGRINVVAWVVQCKGVWEDRTDAHHPAQLACEGAKGDIWRPLSRESKLLLVGRKPGQWIDIRIALTGEKHRFDCDNPGECDPPPAFINLVPPDVGVLGAFFAAPGKSYALVRVLMSRSDNDDEAGRIIRDHVVASQGAPITARDLLRPTAPPGEYHLELCPFDPANGCRPDNQPASLRLDPRSPATWPRPVEPGLFEIVLNRIEDGAPKRTADRGMLLVVTKGDEGIVREKVKAGEQLFLGQWKDKAEGRLLFEALLVDLASHAR